MHDETHMFKTTIRIMNNIVNDIQGELFCYESHCAWNDFESGLVYDFKSTSDPDILHHHQAMKVPNRQQFCNAMDKEIKD